jgi:hypothetical protein
LSVMLNACSAQTREAVLVDRELPAEEFLGRQRVALAGLIEAQETTANGGHHFGLAADHPSPCVGRRKIRNRQRATVRPDDIFCPRAMRLGHDTLTQTQTDLVVRDVRPRFLSFRKRRRERPMSFQDTR